MDDAEREIGGVAERNRSGAEPSHFHESHFHENEGAQTLDPTAGHLTVEGVTSLLNRVRDHAQHSAEVAVMGGGPAGLAAAIALRLRGFSVAVYDAQQPPIDKACGEGLMPEAARLLAAMGLDLDAATARFDGISFHDAHTRVGARFERGCGLALRRTELQTRMASLAEHRGVVLHWGASVRALADGFAAAGTPIRAGTFVIADGQCSTLAAASGFTQQSCSSVRYASRQHFASAPWSALVEVHWGLHEQLYITPLAKSQVGIALVTSRRGRKLAQALPDFPQVAERLGGSSPSSTVRGAVTRTRSLRHVVRGNVAVLGDASGSVDAVTGEGILSALRQANALAAVLAQGRLDLYEEEHRRIHALPTRMAKLLLLLDRHPALVRRVLTTFAARPQLFSSLLRLHLGEQGLSRCAVDALTAICSPHTLSQIAATPQRQPCLPERGL